MITLFVIDFTKCSLIQMAIQPYQRREAPHHLITDRTGYCECSHHVDEHVPVDVTDKEAEIYLALSNRA